MQIIPAPIGYFALDCYEDLGELHLIKTAIVAWQIDLADPNCAWPLPVMLSPETNALATLRPDGVVEGNVGDCEYASAEAWLERMNIDMAAAKARKAARAAVGRK